MDKKLPQANPAYAAPVVLKTISVINTILHAGRNIGISEIASSLSLAKSTTHGILAALEQSGWVLRDPLTRKYTCGHQLKETAATAQVRVPMVDKARPYLEVVGAQLDEDVLLGMFTPHYLLILDVIESSKRLKVSTKPGTQVPILAGAAGRIFLAFHERAMVEELVRGSGLPRYTDNSITDPDEYLKELEKVRQEGVALDREEYIRDVRAVAAPIFHGTKMRKRIVAGVWVVGLSSSFTLEKMERAVGLAKDATAEISRVISS